MSLTIFIFRNLYPSSVSHPDVFWSRLGVNIFIGRRFHFLYRCGFVVSIARRHIISRMHIFFSQRNENLFSRFLFLSFLFSTQQVWNSTTLISSFQKNAYLVKMQVERNTIAWPIKQNMEHYIRASGINRVFITAHAFLQPLVSLSALCIRPLDIYERR